MIDELINEYVANAEAAESVDYADVESVQWLNDSSDRMREIVAEVVTQERTAHLAFATLLDRPPASRWAAHHLVEMAELEPALLSKCFAIVERIREEAEANGDFATAMGEQMWLKEWRAKT